MSRPGYVLRDAALGYASRGIPVLPLHHPVAHLHGVHQRHMASQRRLPTQPVPPPLLAWIQQLRARRRDQEPER